MHTYYVAMYKGDHVEDISIITIPSKSLIGRFTLNNTDDNIVECQKSFNIMIVSVAGIGVTIGNPNKTKVIIMDNDSKWHIHFATYRITSM